MKPCDMNIELKIKDENDFEKDFIKLIKKRFKKIMENVREYKYIKLVTSEERKKSICFRV